MIDDSSPTTQKVGAIPKMNEKEFAQYVYDRALEKMLAEPTQANIEAFGKANAKLFEVEDAYRIALRLLSERARNLASALGFNKRY